MSKEYLEAFERIKELPDSYRKQDVWEHCYMVDCEKIEQALQRLESIENANPSEALECLEELGEMYYVEADNLEESVITYANECDWFNTIKNCILKAQEPKKYLKWEDLEFEHTPKYIDVKMNGNKYKLVVGYNGAGKNLVILRNDKQPYYFLKYDKQFFNDLHLERVEE